MSEQSIHTPLYEGASTGTHTQLSAFPCISISNLQTLPKGGEGPTYPLFIHEDTEAHSGPQSLMETAGTQTQV